MRSLIITISFVGLLTSACAPEKVLQKVQEPTTCLLPKGVFHSTAIAQKSSSPEAQYKLSESPFTLTKVNGQGEVLASLILNESDSFGSLAISNEKAFVIDDNNNLLIEINLSSFSIESTSPLSQATYGQIKLEDNNLWIERVDYEDFLLISSTNLQDKTIINSNPNCKTF